LQERAADIARQLSDSHWTSTCVVTISKFNSFFVDREDAHVALCFLTQNGKARHLSGRKQDPIEVCSLFLVHSVILLKRVPTTMLHFVQLHSCLQGVKFALTASQVPAVSKLDHDTLHLVWTEEKLQGQLDVLDRRWEM
jgi:charged multivesicular body protein 7